MRNLDFLPGLLEEGVFCGCFPSAVCAVGRGGEVLFTGAAGQGDLATRYDMASLTKVVSTTMVALRAIEEGAITLDDPLSHYFDAPKDKAAITIRQLMTHTGGFVPDFWLFNEITDPDDAAACILRHPLVAAPDGTPRYSCMGYILLGKLLEKAIGAPLDVLARQWAFEPLGMGNTGYRPAGENIAPTEKDPATGIPWQGIVHDENARFLRGISGNAGVFSDIGDMIRFARMLALGGEGFLAPGTLALAIQNHTPGRDAHRGLGFQVGGLPGTFMGDLFPANSFGHTGFTGTSLLAHPGTGLYVALLTNRVHPTRTNEKLFQFRRALHNRIWAALGE